MKRDYDLIAGGDPGRGYNELSAKGSTRGGKSHPPAGRGITSRGIRPVNAMEVKNASTHW